ncbi:hypothetical protein GCM10028798_25370 [Humibacter antri]
MSLSKPGLGGFDKLNQRDCACLGGFDKLNQRDCACLGGFDKLNQRDCACLAGPRTTLDVTMNHARLDHRRL